MKGKRKSTVGFCHGGQIGPNELEGLKFREEFDEILRRVSKTVVKFG
jgi:hypothetical protein